MAYVTILQNCCVFFKQKTAYEMLRSLVGSEMCIRDSVGGDYYSQEYCEAWESICQARPDTLFWSYTRSWNARILLPSLERLRQQTNLQLFASTDPDMPLPPAHWRAAFIEIDPRANGIPCRHQQGEVASCLECGYCFHRRFYDLLRILIKDSSNDLKDVFANRK